MESQPEKNMENGGNWVYTAHYKDLVMLGPSSFLTVC